MLLTKFCDPMGAFRKKKVVSQFIDRGSAHAGDIEVTTTKDVEIGGSITTIVEHVKKNVHDYAESLGLPTSEEYKLEEMLRAGHIPEAVPVSGMLDNPDPTALENQADVQGMFADFKSMEPAPEPEPSKTE